MKNILVVLFAISCTVKNPYNFDLKNIQGKNPEISSIQNEVLKIKPNSENQTLTVWEGNGPELWKNANYLVCEIWHVNGFSAKTTTSGLRIFATGLTRNLLMPHYKPT
ncbi:MAG: hypothetical protein FD181_217 [Prolixibacteraceae bacterium]|nr:MAG: hypothetical protein FD181_217 [Prolixibacteraceae bacterium]